MDALKAMCMAAGFTFISGAARHAERAEDAARAGFCPPTHSPSKGAQKGGLLKPIPNQSFGHHFQTKPAQRGFSEELPIFVAYAAILGKGLPPSERRICG